MVAASRANLEIQSDRGEKESRAVRGAGDNREENEGPAIYFFIFIWPPQVSVAALQIFRCSMQALSCGMWHLVPWSGIKPRPPALGAWSLASGPPGKSPNRFFRLRTAARSMKTLIILYWQRTLSLEEPKESFHSTLLFKRNGTKVEKGQMTCPMSTGHTAAKPGCTQVSQLSSISAGLSQGQCCSQGTPELSGDNFGCHRGRVLVAAGGGGQGCC